MNCAVDIRDYPHEIGCLVTEGFVATIFRKTKFLGGYSATIRHPIITGNILLSSKERVKEIKDWWEKTLHFGATPFYIDIVIFGVPHRAEMMMISNLNEVVKDNHSLAPVTLEIMNVEIALVRPNYIYELVCGTEALCEDVLICT